MYFVKGRAYLRLFEGQSVCGLSVDIHGTEESLEGLTRRFLRISTETSGSSRDVHGPAAAGHLQLSQKSEKSLSQTSRKKQYRLTDVLDPRI
jgi:hypothetical protein